MENQLAIKSRIVAWKVRRIFIHRFGTFGIGRRTTEKRLLLLTIGGPIGQAQVFPFHYYARDIAARWNIEIREAPVDAFKRAPSRFRGAADAVAFQTWFDLDRAMLTGLAARIREYFPNARVGYLDWFAPADLRFAETLDPLIDAYLKKHVLRDRAAYNRPTLGDTNLTDHFNRRFGLPDEPRLFRVPDSFFQKLFVGQNFALSDYMLPEFARPFRETGQRPIDVHARFTARGSPWYQRMREEARDRVNALKGLNVRSEGKVSRPAFLRELRQSKLCVGPFGYGEVSWRDFEAMMCGCVLVKPDMSHIETKPDAYQPWRTYAPVAWDWSDLDAVCARLINDESERRRIAETAHGVIAEYLRERRWLEDIAPFLAALGLA